MGGGGEVVAGFFAVEGAAVFDAHFDQLVVGVGFVERAEQGGGDAFFAEVDGGAELVAEAAEVAAGFAAEFELGLEVLVPVLARCVRALRGYPLRSFSPDILSGSEGYSPTPLSCGYGEQQAAPGNTL